jgi:predicted aminopeptidase
MEQALKNGSLGPDQKARLALVSRIKDFGEKELGLKKTGNYQTVYLRSHEHPIYCVSASPKDSLSRVSWWFPVVGDMPYLGFFDLERAKAKKEKLVKKDLDVIISRADAYSTLGWFKDPVTRNLIEGSTVDLVETILHEMTHTTLYVKGQDEFNEGLAVLVGKAGALSFLERTYGPSHPFTTEARQSLEDERLFCSFLISLLEELKGLYDSPASYEDKLARRKEIFTAFIGKFNHLKTNLQTRRFIDFGTVELNNAYIMSIGLYHQQFHVFEAVLRAKGNSIKEMLLFLQKLAEKNGDILESMRVWSNG